ncbi:hypothetical protein H072_11470 [Dactylellina haptotyla CBS 200.50]|uniref:Uncharacterized protein n=1 Tax=Dactylellina haptotyla (strain CBS 200.50) TaxID=1284197 RepID=S8A1Z3_DACHA|nr:hypothetical protein H072_11470 [Dactylellina haptotyla CBS 200.50]
MGNINSKHYHTSQKPVTLLWNDELIGACSLSELQRNFPRLRQGFHNFDPRGERLSRTHGHTSLVFDLAPCRDLVLWASQPEPHPDEARLLSPTRFGGSEALRIVVFTLFRRLKNGQTYNIRAALSEAFVAGYPFRHEFSQQRDQHRQNLQYNDEDLGIRDISAYLTLLESFVEVSLVLECLDNGQNPTREHIENSYSTYRKHIKHTLDNVEESLRFLHVGDLLAHTQMMQDFTFPVLSSFDTLFKRYSSNSHNVTFAQYGERQWGLSRRLCDYLELEHNEFQKRKKAREAAILNDIPRPLLPGIGLEGDGLGVYEDQMVENSMFITLSPQILQKIIESSPVTVHPTQSAPFHNSILPPDHAPTQAHITGGSGKENFNHDHVVIQLRVFTNPSKHGSLNLMDQADRLTPSHTPIPSRRGSPAPSDYFFGPHPDHHGFPPRSSNMAGGPHHGGMNSRSGHGLHRNNTFHSIDDFGFPQMYKGEFGPEIGRFGAKDDRYRSHRACGIDDIGINIDSSRLDPFVGGNGAMSGVGAFGLQTVMARMMAQAVREEKKREYTMPWARNGGIGCGVNGPKLIGYTNGEGYR